MGVALERRPQCPLVVLFVHQDNARARDMYAKNQFSVVGKPVQQPNGLYDRMVLVLPE